MKLYLVSFVASLAMVVTATRAGAHIGLHPGGKNPVCVQVLKALQRVPSTTPLLTWPQHLPPIPGFARPHWISLNPSKYLNTIRDYTVHVRREFLDQRSAQAIWEEFGPKIEQAARSGVLRLEETTVRHVKLGVPSETPAERPWKTDIRFIRVGYPVPLLSLGTLALPAEALPAALIKAHGSTTSWSYMAASFSLFPKVHDVPIENGLGDMDLLLVDGQPWFFVGPLQMGIPYTNDLEETGPSVVHGIYVDESCMFIFPYPTPKGK